MIDDPMITNRSYNYVDYEELQSIQQETTVHFYEGRLFVQDCRLFYYRRSEAEQLRGELTGTICWLCTNFPV